MSRDRKPDDGGWVRRSARRIYENPWFRLRQDELTLPGGEEITYTVIEHDGWAMVVPVLDDGRVLMERIYRHPLQRTQLECPSGGCDGDDPETAARRELEEETGYVAGELIHLGRFASRSGISDEQYDAFLAPSPSGDGRMQREATEQMELELIHLGELRRRALAGEIEDGPSALAILLAAQHLGVD